MRRFGWLCLLASVGLVAGGCSRSSSSAKTPAAAPTTAVATAAAPNTTAGSGTTNCNVALQATDIGVTPTTITIEVMADVGSPLAPGLFQGNIDAIKAFANYVNNNGGIACRKLVVRTWDSKLDPTEAEDGQIDSCQNAFAMVGTNALFNPDVTPMTGCVDKNGQATGLPDLAAVTADASEECAPTAFVIPGVPDKCPITSGVRQIIVPVGPIKWQLKQHPGLHGLFLVAGDLPSTVQVETPAILADQQAGMVWDGTPKVSGADAQPAYTPRVQLAKAKASTYVYDGSNDVAMVRMRKEAAAQGLTSVKVWDCSIACYTQAFLAQGGSAVDGTYISMGFLPFEEASYNAEDQAYVNAVGLAKVDSFGAGAWQAGVAFQTAVNMIVAKDGPNAVTRANLIQTLRGIKNFSANGWAGPKAFQGPGSISPCFLIMQVQNGKFVRVYPTQPGTMDCNPGNLVTVSIDPVVAAAKIK
jgi:hypothetical protein